MLVARENNKAIVAQEFNPSFDLHARFGKEDIVFACEGDRCVILQ